MSKLDKPCQRPALSPLSRLPNQWAEHRKGEHMRFLVSLIQGPVTMFTEGEETIGEQSTEAEEYLMCQEGRSVV